MHMQQELTYLGSGQYRIRCTYGWGIAGPREFVDLNWSAHYAKNGGQ